MIVSFVKPPTSLPLPVTVISLTVTPASLSKLLESLKKSLIVVLAVTAFFPSVAASSSRVITKSLPDFE